MVCHERRKIHTRMGSLTNTRTKRRKIDHTNHRQKKHAYERKSLWRRVVASIRVGWIHRSPIRGWSGGVQLHIPDSGVKLNAAVIGAFLEGFNGSRVWVKVAQTLINPDLV